MRHLSYIFALLLSLSAGAWWDSDFTKRFAITSEATLVDEDLGVYRFPLSSAPAGFWANVDSAGDDVRMADDGDAEIPIHLVYFDSVGEDGAIYFKDAGSTSVDVTWYVYYNNSGASAPAVDSTYGRNAVWAEYAAVYVLDETFEGKGDGDVPVVDVTGNGYDLDEDSGISTLAPTDGQTADWPAFDFSGSQLIYETTVPISDWPMTISAWGEPDNITAAMQATTLGSSGGTQTLALLSFRGDIDDKVRGVFRGDSGATASGAIASTTFSANAWAHAVTTRDDDSGTSTAYYNGANSGTDTTTIVAPTFNRISVGGWQNSSPIHYFDGKVSSVKYYAGVRSADFVATEYSMESDPGSFWTTGAEETAPAGGGNETDFFFMF